MKTPSSYPDDGRAYHLKTPSKTFKRDEHSSHKELVVGPGDSAETAFVQEYTHRDGFEKCTFSGWVKKSDASKLWKRRVKQGYTLDYAYEESTDGV